MQTTDTKVVAASKKINVTALILTIVISLAFLIAGIVSIVSSSVPKKLAVGKNTVTLSQSYTEFTFTPSVSGSYTFTTGGSYDTMASLYKGNSLLESNDDVGADRNFSITRVCTAGVTYTLRVKSTRDCTVTLFVIKQ